MVASAGVSCFWCCIDPFSTVGTTVGGEVCSSNGRPGNTIALRKEIGAVAMCVRASVMTIGTEDWFDGASGANAVLRVALVLARIGIRRMVEMDREVPSIEEGQTNVNWT